MPTVDVVVPDIGTEDKVDVIEVLVKPGDRVAIEDPLVSLESDKATMDVPAPQAGVVHEIKVNAGDKIGEGSVVLSLNTDADASVDVAESAPAQPAPAASAPAPSAPAPAPAPAPAATSAAPTPVASSATSATREVTIAVPDVGTEDAVDVIDVHVKVGDSVAIDDALITLESDKASMDVPATSPGTITAVHVSAGDKVSNGDHIVTLTSTASESAEAPTPSAQSAPSVAASASTGTSDHARVSPGSAKVATRAPVAPPPPFQSHDADPRDPASVPHASPSVRRFARELGADLAAITGTGRKGRVQKEDVQQWVKAQLSGGASSAAGAGGMGIPPIPAVDFSKFGDTETVELSRIKRISGPFLQRSWLNLPHVTHHDEADITEMDEFRRSLKKDAEARGVKLTPLVFAMRALVTALREFPQFNASLAPDGEHLILKKYFHIGIAVDTPGGLVVPVVRDVDQKGLFDLAAELGDISSRARDGKLKSAELQGGSMSISSLGGIGGTAFTPIVNAPEVAILGLARSRMQPVWDGSAFQPRLMQPIDLSYDHRVVDGAEAARFTVFLRDNLADIRRLVL